MAWDLDFVYLRRMIDAGVVRGRVLEIGSLNHQGHDEGNAKATCERAGLAWEGADLAHGRDVDLTFDLTDTEAVRAVGRRWDTLLLFNLLEHVFDPVRALDNARVLLEPGGAIVVSGPAIWDLHDYPADYWRPMPGFFAEWSRRSGLDVVAGSPTWLVNDRLVPLEALSENGGRQRLAPSQRHPAQVYGRRRRHPLRVAGFLAGRSGATVAEFPPCSFSIALRRPDSG